MKRLLLLLLLAGPAQAEVAAVRSGEHPEFTRIVVEAAAAGDWRLGRAGEGYALQLGAEVTGFDLAQAFDKIPRDRVSGLWRDPESGQLRFSLSCACHAIAFEYRPGVVVIDIKPGLPPAGSAFELPLVGAVAEPEALSEAELASEPEPVEALLPAGPPAAPKAPVYDWLAERAAKADLPVERPLPLPMKIEDPRIDPLRDALLAQISRGAAAGLVQIAEHPVLADPAGAGQSAEPGMRIVSGDLPGMVAGTVRDPGPNLTAEGQPCLSDADLALADWMLPGPPAEQLGLARAGLLGEFDAPQPAAIHRAARAHIALGFGAEARQILGLLGPEEDEETRLLTALAHAVDQEPGDPGLLTGMAACDTAAALWAALAMTASGGAEPSQLAALNDQAVSRAFSALPPHLRRNLGPPLVALLLGAGKEAAARRIRDAILRAPGEGGPDVALMEAGYELATGDGAHAAALAEEVSRDAGSQGPEALITLVEAAFASGSAVPPDLPAQIDAYRGDAHDGATYARLTRAHLLASALTGDFASAFAELPQARQAEADLWSLAAAGASDAVFLEQAVPAAHAALPSGAGAVALTAARRLQDLGFPEEALVWLGPVDAASPLERRLLAAEAALALRDARGAMQALAGLREPEAERLRAAAVLQLGDAETAAAALDRAGEAEAAKQARVWGGAWPLVAEAGAEPWKSAAALVAALPPPAEDAASGGGAAEAGQAAAVDPTAPAEGPLARGATLVADSAEARAAVEALLTTVTP